MLIDDIDLVRIEPRVFLDCQVAATALVAGTDGTVSGTALTSAGSNFVTADIGNGNVIIVNGEPLEVDSRTSATVLEVSRPRAASTDAKIKPVAGSSLAFSVHTFERAILAEESWVLGALGIDPEHPTVPLDDTVIVDLAPVERLIGLRVIARAFETASAQAPTNAALKEQAGTFRRRANEERQRTIAYIDRDGDGVPDATRRISVVQFSRA